MRTDSKLHTEHAKQSLWGYCAVSLRYALLVPCILKGGSNQYSRSEGGIVLEQVPLAKWNDSCPRNIGVLVHSGGIPKETRHLVRSCQVVQLSVKENLGCIVNLECRSGLKVVHI